MSSFQPSSWAASFALCKLWLVVTLIRNTADSIEPCHHHYSSGHNDHKQEIIVCRCYVRCEICHLSDDTFPPLIVFVPTPSLQNIIFIKINSDHISDLLFLFYVVYGGYILYLGQLGKYQTSQTT